MCFMGDVSSRFLSKNIDSLIGLGTPESDLLRLVPGGRPALGNPLARFDGNILIEALNFAEAAMDDPAIGFKCGLNHGHVTYNDIAHTILFCANLQESFEVSIRYEPLVQKLGVNELLLDGDDAHIIWKTHEDAPDKLRHVSDLHFATLARLGLWIKAVHGLSVKNMQVRHRDERYRDQYQNMFNCEVEYGCSQDVLTFDKAFLDVPLPGNNPDVLKGLVGRLEHDFSRLNESPTQSELVRAYLEKMLGNEAPTIKLVSELIETPEWKLRRQLKDEGTSFREILEKIRRERYEILVAQPTMTQAQIAGQLGYSEQSAFSRAYKKWYGRSPSQANN